MPGLGKGYWEGALGVRGVWGGGGVGVYGVINQRVKCTLKVISFVEGKCMVVDYACSIDSLDVFYCHSKVEREKENSLTKYS